MIDPENASMNEVYVRERAYYLWLADGMQHGRHEEYWSQAASAVAAEGASGPDSHLIELISLNKPATQSSISIYSHRQSTETDAALGNDGDLNPLIMPHTSLEENPWWQVDLQGLFVIFKVVLFNRLHEVQDRLNSFSLLGSVDGSTWDLFHSKSDEIVFDSYDMAVVPERRARFVRIRLDGTNYLHFRECQVFGRPV